MKQLLILSGKGGTGKTTVASAFIKLSNAKAFADCDVDAPNLHLITSLASEPRKKKFYGLNKAKIDASRCVGCDACRSHCRFNAISVQQHYVVDEYACEGCGVCEFVCPQKAISMIEMVDGELMLYHDEEKVFSTAQLAMGSGTSGMLVTEVKKQLKEVDVDGELTIIDGSPGIGCPVIASLSGVDMVLIVAEPSISGISDMERIIKTAEKFSIKIAICINKYDTNNDNTEKIDVMCKEKQWPIVGKIPFDPQAVSAINQGKTIVDVECPAKEALIDVYNKTLTMLYGKQMEEIKK